MLPSESAITQTYGVSRQTARAAVNVLRAEGLAELIPGRGIVVREPVEMQDLMPPAGAAVTARMPTLEERGAYDIGEGIPVFSVAAADGTVQIFPADRWRLVWPS